MPAAKAEVEWLIALIGNLRGAKNELGIAPGAKLEAYLAEPVATRPARSSTATPARSTGWRGSSAIRFEPAPAGAAMQVGAGDASARHPARRRDRHRRRKGAPDKALAASQKEAQVARRPARQPGVRREGQARGGRQGPRRPRRTTPPRPSGWRRRWRGWGELAARRLRTAPSRRTASAARARLARTASRLRVTGQGLRLPANASIPSRRQADRLRRKP